MSLSVPSSELGWTDIADPRRGVAEDDHSRAVVIVDERPEITAGAHHGPLRHDVLPGVSVALQEQQQSERSAAPP